MERTYAELLACPRCRGALDVPSTDDGICACRKCGARFPIRRGTPRLSDGAVERNARLAAEWAAQSKARSLYLDEASIMNAWEIETLPRMIDWLGASSGPILDLGCGVGHAGRALAARGDQRELIGLDFQGELLDQATLGYVARIEGDIHRLPFRDGAFAGVVASNSLHHVADVDLALREIARVLRPGGVFVTHDPRHVAPLELAKRIVRRGDDMFTDDHRSFRVGEYRALLDRAGLSLVEVATVDPIGPLVATALDYAKLGRLGVAPRLARALVRIDRAIVGRRGSSVFGLMLAGRAVKPSMV